MNSSRDRDYIPVNTKVNEETTTLSFKPHVTQRLIESEHTKTSLDHEILHTLRESYDGRSPSTARSVTASSLDYALWLEAGKHAHKPTYAKSLDGKPPINYNIWRNYRQYYFGINGNGARRSSAKSRLTEEAALKYPIVIPAPSQLGENHLRNFFESNRRELFQNQSNYRMALIQADNDEKMLRMLSLKSQQRNPPISSDNAEESKSSDVASQIPKPSSASTKSSQQLPPQNSASISPQPGNRHRYGSGRKLVMKDNHPSLQKLKFEQELKIAISFHRELKRSREGSERSVYARHQPA